MSTDDTTDTADDGATTDEPASPYGVPAVAGSGRRLAAFLVDVWGLPPLLITLWAWLPRAQANVLALLTLVVLLVGTEARFGATPGKALAGLRVRRTDGSLPGLRAAVVRRSWLVFMYVIPAVGSVLAGVAGMAAVGIFIAMASSSAVFLWTLLTVYRDPDGRGWHDHAARTVVIVERPVARPLVLVLAGLLVIGGQLGQSLARPERAGALTTTRLTMRDALDGPDGPIDGSTITCTVTTEAGVTQIAASLDGPVVEQDIDVDGDDIDLTLTPRPSLVRFEVDLRGAQDEFYESGFSRDRGLLEVTVVRRDAPDVDAVSLRCVAD